VTLLHGIRAGPEHAEKAATLEIHKMADELGNDPKPWWAPERGDIDAIVAQVGFNLAQMVIPIFLLLPLGIQIDFAVTHFLPGYALGFLVGSLALAALALGLRKREKRADVTAHVYGNNVPAVIVYTLSIFLPVYLQTHDVMRAWQIGAAAVIWTGIIKLALAPFAGVIRRVIPVPELTPERLSTEIFSLLDQPGEIERQSCAARSLARPNAARDIVNMIEEVARG